MGWLLAPYWRSPPPSSPQPSATLVPDEVPMVPIDPKIARTLTRLDDVAEGLVRGDIKNLVVFAETDAGVAYLWLLPDELNHEPMALAIKEFGHDLHKGVVRTQGNAPPQNRSNRAQ